MTLYLPFSADGHQARWTAGERATDATDSSSSSTSPPAAGRGEHDGWGEHVDLKWDNEAWTVMGQLVHERVSYVVRLSPTFAVRQLMLFRDMDEPDLWLGTDGRGRWGEMNGAHRPDLDGGADVRVGDSVFAFGTTIRRLALPTGGSAQVAMIDIDPETLAVVVKHRAFHRVGSHRWRVEPTTEGLVELTAGPVVGSIEFDVDEHGLPRDIAEVVRQG